MQAVWYKQKNKTDPPKSGDLVSDSDQSTPCHNLASPTSPPCLSAQLAEDSTSYMSLTPCSPPLTSPMSSPLQRRRSFSVQSSPDRGSPSSASTPYTSLSTDYSYCGPSNLHSPPPVPSNALPNSVPLREDESQSEWQSE